MAEEVDLVGFIDFKQCECLNAAEPEKMPWERCLKQGLREDNALALVSECDEQLLLNLGFTQMVNLKSIAIAGPEGKAPKTIKLFCNTRGFGFEDAEQQTPSQELELSGESGKFQLKTLTFLKCASLSIFVENNQEDGEVTEVFKVVLSGVPVATTNVSELKKVEE